MLSTNTGLSPSSAWLSIHFLFLHNNHWPGPRSLATTNGVSFDVLSSGYLDVSVPRVRLTTLCIQVAIPLMWWVSPFRYLRIKGCSHLPATFRSVPRLSSPLKAKASTKCPFALVFIDTISCAFFSVSPHNTHINVCAMSTFFLFDLCILKHKNQTVCILSSSLFNRSREFRLSSDKKWPFLFLLSDHFMSKERHPLLKKTWWR